MLFFPRRMLAGLVLLATVCVILSPAGAETFQLKLKQLEERSRYADQGDDPDFLFKMTYPQHFWLLVGMIVQETRPGESDFASLVKKEPEKYQSEHPFRNVAKLGSEKFLLVLDSSNLAENGYDVLYFDVNGNGDLTDDKPLRAMPLPEGVTFPSNYNSREFPRVDVPIHVEGERIDYAFSLLVHSQFQEDILVYSSASLNAAAYREGEVTLDGKRRRIVLLDFNSNGRFDDVFTVNQNMRSPDGRVYPNQGDMLLIDPDTKDRNTFGYGPNDRKERQPVSNLLSVDGRYYDVRISPAGDTLTLTPSTVALGSVKNSNERYAATVYNATGLVKITGTKSEAIPLPEGDWKLLDYVIDLTKPGKDKKVTRVAAAGTRDYPVVKVRRGESTELPFGPPYKPLVKVSPFRRSSTDATLDLFLVGSAGEICSDMRVDGDQPGKPTFSIANAKGKIIERGSFEYG